LKVRLVDLQHVVHTRPNGYPFLDELDGTPVGQISFESMQQQVDLAALERVPHKTVILGVIDLRDDAPVETPEAVAAQIRRALEHTAPERLLLSPDCGMKYLPRPVAFAKLQALVAGTKLVRKERGIPD
jgi:5-methyltetrahydropteroyltriglutamate--homocysteine methyltransferase